MLGLQVYTLLASHLLKVIQVIYGIKRFKLNDKLVAQKLKKAISLVNHANFNYMYESYDQAS